MPAIDVVEMPDGGYTTVDNRRLAAAQEANVPVFVRKLKGDTPISRDQAARFPGIDGSLPEAWAEAVENRVSKQKPKAHAEENPSGFRDFPTKKYGGGSSEGFTHPFFTANAAAVSEALTSLFNVFTAQRFTASGRKNQ